MSVVENVGDNSSPFPGVRSGHFPPESGSVRPVPLVPHPPQHVFGLFQGQPDVAFEQVVGFRVCVVLLEWSRDLYIYISILYY